MEHQIWYIYKTTCLITGMSYVGKHTTKNGLVDKNYFGSGKIILQALEKYGRENFIQEILEFNPDEKTNCLREKFWIKELNTQRPNGYNITPGGEGGISYWDSETNTWLSQNTWNNYSLEERKARIEKMKQGLQRSEVKKKISDKAKLWHKNMSKEENLLWRKALSEGWSKESKDSAKQRLSDYNKTHKMKDKLISKYGEQEGLKRYEEWKQKVAVASKNNVEGRRKEKETKELLKKFPEYKERNQLISKITVAKKLYNNGKLDKETSDKIIEDARKRLLEIKEILRRKLENERNNA